MRGRYIIWGQRQRDEAPTFGAGRARGPLIKRWIGAARRRSIRVGRAETGHGAEVVELTWAQTFGRPSGPRSHAAGVGPTLLFQPRPCA